MLIVWNKELLPRDQQDLCVIDPHATFWPRNWAAPGIYSACLPTQWWISFSHQRHGMLWVLKYPDYCQVKYRV